MRNLVFIVASLLGLLTLGIDALYISSGLTILGILLILTTLAVFGSGFIWVILKDEEKIKLRKPWLVIPLALFAGGIVKLTIRGEMTFQPSPEDLLGVGNLIMSRYQIALWLVSAIMLLVFVMAGSIMSRRNT